MENKIENEKLPKVNVLLAAYNGEKYIEEQISSILNQKSVEVTITISLDKSTDNTLKILNTLKEKYSNIVLLSYGNKYGAAAPNFYRLINDSDIDSYDFIALADQDDIWFENKIISGIKKLRETGAVGYSSNITAFWEDGRKREIIKATPQRLYDYLFESPGPGCSFVLAQTFAREIQDYFKEHSQQLKKLDWHDWVIYAYARAKGYKWVIESQSYMLYRQHSSNQLGANSGLKQFRKRVREIISGYGISQTIDTVKFLDLEDDQFVKHWWRNGKIFPLILLCYSNKCRRRVKDRFMFFASCIVMAICRTQYNEKVCY